MEEAGAAGEAADQPPGGAGPPGGDHPAGVHVAVTRERHVWTLEDWPITQLSFEAGGIRLIVSKLAGSAEIRLGGHFTLDSPAGSRALDAAETDSLAPLLSLLGLPLGRIDVGADGGLTLSIGGRVILVRPDPRFPAWAAQGSGVLDGLGYVCSRDGAAPWEGPRSPLG